MPINMQIFITFHLPSKSFRKKFCWGFKCYVGVLVTAASYGKKNQKTKKKQEKEGISDHILLNYNTSIYLLH